MKDFRSPSKRLQLRNFSGNVIVIVVAGAEELYGSYADNLDYDDYDGRAVIDNYGPGAKSSAVTAGRQVNVFADHGSLAVAGEIRGNVHIGPGGPSVTQPGTPTNELLVTAYVPSGTEVKFRNITGTITLITSDGHEIQLKLQGGTLTYNTIVSEGDAR